MEYRITNNMENTAIARQFANTIETSQGHKLNGRTKQHLFVGFVICQRGYDRSFKHTVYSFHKKGTFSSF